MKRIKKGELYQHVDTFLKTKGVELKTGSYTERIQRVCGLLSDIINTSQSGLERAKEETEKRLDQVRQVIHEKTAPRTAQSATPPPAAAAEKSPPHRKSRAKRPGKSSRKLAKRRPTIKKAVGR